MYIARSITFILFIGFLLSACAGALTSGNNPGLPEAFSPTEEVAPATQTTDSPTTDEPTKPLLPEESPPVGAAREFSTDFHKHTVSYTEILSGGPRKDGIPAIDNPKFVRVEEADNWLKPLEPVILIEVEDEARAYPIQILMWHEIVNDTVGDLPLTVTFCPLCNTAIAFERKIGDNILDFGTTGRLRYSNLIMYDRQTETWWQQANGEAISGEMTGAHLKFYPAAMISWQEYKSTHPNGLVLSRETGYSRSYGRNPYTGYDNINNPPFLYDGPETPDVLPPVARVLTVDLNGEAVAYPYNTLQLVQVINDQAGGQPIVVFWAAGTASALDKGSVAGGRDVGAANAFNRVLNGQELQFAVVGGKTIDQQTGSEWNVLGQAISGKLAGKKLDPVIAINHFWFSWAAFKPETRIYQP